MIFPEGMQQHSICVQKKGSFKQGASLVSTLCDQGYASLTGDRPCSGKIGSLTTTQELVFQMLNVA
jgi:hypothetical protein